MSGKTEALLFVDRGQACVYDYNDKKTTAYYDIGLLNKQKQETPPWVRELDKWFVPLPRGFRTCESPWYENELVPDAPPWDEDTDLAEFVRQRPRKFGYVIKLRAKTAREVISEAKKGNLHALEAWYYDGSELGPEAPRVIADNLFGRIKKVAKRPTRSPIARALRDFKPIAYLVYAEIQVFLKEHFPKPKDRAINKRAFTLTVKETGLNEIHLHKWLNRADSDPQRLVARYHRLTPLYKGALTLTSKETEQTATRKG